MNRSRQKGAGLLASGQRLLHRRGQPIAPWRAIIYRDYSRDCGERVRDGTGGCPFCIRHSLTQSSPRADK